MHSNKCGRFKYSDYTVSGVCSSVINYRYVLISKQHLCMQIKTAIDKQKLQWLNNDYYITSANNIYQYAW